MVDIVWMSARLSASALASTDTEILGQLLVSGTGASAFRVASMDWFVAMDKSGGSADGEAAVFVLTDGDLTENEVEQTLNLNNLDSGDRIAHGELARREVHPFAMTSTPDRQSDHGHAKINRTLHGGIKILLYNPNADPWVASIDFSCLIKFYGVWVN